MENLHSRPVRLVILAKRTTVHGADLLWRSGAPWLEEQPATAVEGQRRPTT